MPRHQQTILGRGCIPIHYTRWMIGLLILAAACGVDRTTGPDAGRLLNRHRSNVYAPDTQDSVCTDSGTVSDKCAEVMQGVLVEGNSDQPSKLIFITVANIPDAPNWDAFPSSQSTGAFYFYGRLIGENQDFAETIVEAACDPKLAGCLLPLQPQDSAFLTRVQQFFKDLNAIPDTTERRECSEMFNKLLQLVNMSFNRSMDDSTGIWRGASDVGNGDLGIHGGATNGVGISIVHLDGYEWDGIHQADSAQQQPRAVSILLHEAAHAAGHNHIEREGRDLNYSDFPYFKQVIIDDPNSCVKQWYQ
jgi:hypothetical protein